MRDEQQPRRRAEVGPDSIRGQGDGVHLRRDETRMVEEVTQLVQLWRRRPQCAGGRRQVVLVLPACGERGVGGRHEHQRVANACLGHLAHDISDVRRPVSISPEHRKVDAVHREVRRHRRDERAVLRVDRRDPAEVQVVPSDRFEPLPRNVATARHVLEERHHVVGALRTTERLNEQRVVAQSCARFNAAGLLSGGCET